MDLSTLACGYFQDNFICSVYLCQRPFPGEGRVRTLALFPTLEDPHPLAQLNPFLLRVRGYGQEAVSDLALESTCSVYVLFLGCRDEVASTSLCVMLFGVCIASLEDGGRGPLRSWPWELQPGPVSSSSFLFPDFLRDNQLLFASHATAMSSFCHYAISALMGCAA